MEEKFIEKKVFRCVLKKYKKKNQSEKDVVLILDFVLVQNVEILIKNVNGQVEEHFLKIGEKQVGKKLQKIVKEDKLVHLKNFVIIQNVQKLLENVL